MFLPHSRSPKPVGLMLMLSGCRSHGGAGGGLTEEKAGVDCQRRSGLPGRQLHVAMDPRERRDVAPWKTRATPGVCRGPKSQEFRRHVGEVGGKGQSCRTRMSGHESLRVREAGEAPRRRWLQEPGHPPSQRGRSSRVRCWEQVALGWAPPQVTVGDAHYYREWPEPRVPSPEPRQAP